MHTLYISNIHNQLLTEKLKALQLSHHENNNIADNVNPNSHGLSFCLKTTGGGLPGPPLLLCDLTIDYHKLDT